MLLSVKSDCLSLLNKLKLQMENECDADPISLLVDASNPRFSTDFAPKPRLQ